MIYFITSNMNKFREVKEMIPEIEQLDLDLPEIQSLDSKEVIRAKMVEAFKHQEGEFIIEDTGLYLDSLNGFPGPLVKHLLKAIGVDGIYEQVERSGDFNAEAVTTIGYAKNPEDMHYFDGRIKGKIVKARGDKDWAWGPIFQPNGSDKTFGEMDNLEKRKYKMRQIAVNKLKEFLEAR